MNKMCNSKKINKSWVNKVKLSDIFIAERNLRNSNLVFPVFLKYCNTLSAKHGVEFYHAMETSQQVKSFKIRGAYNAIFNLSASQRKRGVICASAGNHAQGVAISASKLGIKSFICMPSNAPLSKIIATKNFGGSVILAKEPLFDSAYKLSKELAKSKGYVEIPPFDSVDVIAGQATIALEILKKRCDIDTFIVPIGGGGLISGIASFAKIFNPNIRIIGVQSEHFPAMKMSFKKNRIISYNTGSPTLADGCAVKTPGNITFDIISHLVDDIVTVTEKEIIDAIATLSFSGKIVAEGAGAMPTAAVLSNKVKFKKNEKVVLMVSGGNIDPIKYICSLLNGAESLCMKSRIKIKIENMKRLALFNTILAKNNLSALDLISEEIVSSKSKIGELFLALFYPNKNNIKSAKSELSKNKFRFSLIN